MTLLSKIIAPYTAMRSAISRRTKKGLPGPINLTFNGGSNSVIKWSGLLGTGKSKFLSNGLPSRKGEREIETTKDDSSSVPDILENTRDENVRDNLALFNDLLPNGTPLTEDQKRLKSIAEQLQLDLTGLPNNVNDLSGGEKKRLELAKQLLKIKEKDKPGAVLYFDDRGNELNKEEF